MFVFDEFCLMDACTLSAMPVMHLAVLPVSMIVLDEFCLMDAFFGLLGWLHFFALPVSMFVFDEFCIMVASTI